MPDQPNSAPATRGDNAQATQASSDQPGRPSIGHVIAAWGVHAFTMSGLAWATLALYAMLNNDIPMMWLWFGIALIVDGVDGTLARKVGVRSAIPWFDGGVVDNLVDYLTWTFLPALFMARNLPLGPEPLPIALMILIIISSLFCYANDGEKSNDNYFVGFPAAWNCVAIIMYVLQTPAWFNIAATIILALLTLVPIYYTHPARVKRFQIPNIIGATAWIFSCAYLVIVYPVQPLWTLILFWVGGGWFMIAGFIRTATGEDK